MYLAPEVYYETIYKQYERDLERRMAYRRALEENPDRILRRRVLKRAGRLVTALGGYVRALQRRRNRSAERVTSASVTIGR